MLKHLFKNFILNLEIKHFYLLIYLMFYLFECTFYPSQGQKELSVTVPPESLSGYLCL